MKNILLNEEYTIERNNCDKDTNLAEISSNQRNKKINTTQYMQNNKYRKEI